MKHSGTGSQVTTVRAVKQDSFNNLFFSLDDHIAMGLFGIDQRSGEIQMVGDLDREERGFYIIIVYVHDSYTLLPHFKILVTLFLFPKIQISQLFINSLQ